MSKVKLAEASIEVSPVLDFKSFEVGARNVAKRLEQASHKVWHKFKHSMKEDFHEFTRNFITGGVLGTISAMVEKVSAQFDEVTQKTQGYFQLFDTLQDTANQFGTTAKGMQVSYAVAGMHQINKEDFNSILTMWQQRLYTLSPQEYAKYSKMSAPQGLFQYLMDMQASGFSKETINKNLAFLFGSRRVTKLMDLALGDIGGELATEGGNQIYDKLNAGVKTMGDAYGKFLLVQSHAETQGLTDTATTFSRGNTLKDFLEAEADHLALQNEKYQSQISDMQTLAESNKALEEAENKLEKAITDITSLLWKVYNHFVPNIVPSKNTKTGKAIRGGLEGINTAVTNPFGFYSSTYRTPQK